MSDRCNQQPQGSYSRNNTDRESSMEDSQDDPMGRPAQTTPAVSSSSSTKRARRLTDEDGRGRKRSPDGWVWRSMTQIVAHASSCAVCAVYEEHIHSADGVSPTIYGAFRVRDSWYSERALWGMLPGCDEIVLMKDRIRRLEGDRATLNDKREEQRVNLRASEAKGSGGSENTSSSGSKITPGPPLPRLSLVHRLAAGPQRDSAAAPPSTSTSASQRAPVTRYKLPQRAPVAPYELMPPPSPEHRPLEGNTMDEDSNDEPVSKAEKKHRRNWVNPSTQFDDEPWEDMVSHLNQLDREREDMDAAMSASRRDHDRSVVDNNGASGSNVKLPHRGTASNRQDARDRGVDFDESTLYDRGVNIPVWEMGENKNLFYRYEGIGEETLVVAIAGQEYRFTGDAKIKAEANIAKRVPPSLNGLRRTGVPVLRNYAKWRSLYRRTCDKRQRLPDMVHKAKRFITNAQVAYPRSWLQAVALEEWKTPQWFIDWSANRPQAPVPQGTSAQIPTPAASEKPKKLTLRQPGVEDTPDVTTRDPQSYDSFLLRMLPSTIIADILRIHTILIILIIILATAFTVFLLHRTPTPHITHSETGTQTEASEIKTEEEEIHVPIKLETIEIKIEEIDIEVKLEEEEIRFATDDFETDLDPLDRAIARFLAPSFL
ncbi:hypothetical protein BJ138DRAFT_1119034 [Hygrophoropsis aurantiaca]|uniref:Uncharacterized protein n=1 Tax=Hygrophoropsis aurantiaca TaxID=72124 RepID=A0ACB7ZVZ6_9AGAM|nr:hypothetical protein BJ138DRAFT_1119034 [Hygrophoropsis aurantiaca]